MCETYPRSTQNHVKPMLRMFASFFFAAAVLLCVCVCGGGGGGGAEAARVQLGRYPCGSVIGIDSSSGVESGWAPRQPEEFRHTGENRDVLFDSRALTTIERSQLRALWGGGSGAARSAVVFELTNTAGSELAASGGRCAVAWDPVRGLGADMEFTAARIAVVGSPEWLGLGVPQSVPRTCVVNITPAAGGPVLRVGTSGSDDETTARGEDGAVRALVLDDPNRLLPLQLRVAPGCRVRLLLDTDRHGSLAPLYKWVPLLAYAVVALGVQLTLGARALASSSPLSAREPMAMFSVLYVGFLGSAVGLMVELASWQSSTGHIPFPGAVTFFLCATAAFAFAMVISTWLHPCRGILTAAIIRTLVFALAVAFLVAMWVRGFAIIGTVTLLVIFAQNAQAAQLLMHFTTQLRAASPSRTFLEDVDSDSNDGELSPLVSGLLWFPLTAPFAPLALLYIELLLACNANSSVSDPSRWKAVSLVETMLGLRSTLCLTIPMVALTCSATAFHGAFLVAALCMLAVGWQSALDSVTTFAASQRAYRLEQGSWARLLWPAVEAELTHGRADGGANAAACGGPPALGPAATVAAVSRSSLPGDDNETGISTIRRGCFADVYGERPLPFGDAFTPHSRSPSSASPPPPPRSASRAGAPHTAGLLDEPSLPRGKRLLTSFTIGGSCALPPRAAKADESGFDAVQCRQSSAWDGDDRSSCAPSGAAPSVYPDDSASVVAARIATRPQNGRAPAPASELRRPALPPGSGGCVVAGPLLDATPSPVCGDAPSPVAASPESWQHGGTVSPAVPVTARFTQIQPKLMHR